VIDRVGRRSEAIAEFSLYLAAAWLRSIAGRS
jgi:hypothetical protein